MSESMKCQCLCGNVQFTATPDVNEMGVCHCSMCRKWSGGTFMAVGCGTSVEFEKDDGLGVYSASKWGERVFCKDCGSTLIWRTKDLSHMSVSAQAFEDPSVFAFNFEIFIDDKPANYKFANDTKKMTGAEVFAKFAPSADEHD